MMNSIVVVTVTIVIVLIGTTEQRSSLSHSFFYPLCWNPPCISQSVWCTPLMPLPPPHSLSLPPYPPFFLSISVDPCQFVSLSRSHEISIHAKVYPGPVSSQERKTLTKPTKVCHGDGPIWRNKISTGPSHSWRCIEPGRYIPVLPPTTIDTSRWASERKKSSDTGVFTLGTKHRWHPSFIFVKDRILSRPWCLPVSLLYRQEGFFSHLLHDQWALDKLHEILWSKRG